jgi:RNA polymerase sigma factor (sigma-70 family)
MTPPEPPPSSLFERLACGDTAALNEVCLRYGSRVYNLAHRSLRGALRARLESGDVAQDSMAAVIRDAPRCRFPSEAAFLGWVRRVVEHRILALAKPRRAPCDAAYGDDAPRADPCAQTPSAIVMHREEGDSVARALADLPQDDRALMIARAVLKLPWDAIARSCNRNQAALQMRYLRLRRQLAAILTRRGLADSGAARMASDTTTTV